MEIRDNPLTKFGKLQTRVLSKSAMSFGENVICTVCSAGVGTFLYLQNLRPGAPFGLLSTTTDSKGIEDYLASEVPSVSADADIMPVFSQIQTF